MKAYIVKGFNQADYEDHIEYIAAVLFDEAEANALTGSRAGLLVIHSRGLRGRTHLQ